MSLHDEVTESIKPGDNFYGYVNERWSHDHPIPADKARVGVFETLTDENIERLKKLLDEPERENEATNIRLLRKYYRVGMDEVGLVRDSADVVAGITARIAAATNTAELLRYVGEYHAHGLSLIWSPYIGPDDKDSRRYLLGFSQSGLGLPDRDYYIENDKQFVTTRQQYKAFLTSLFELLDMGDAQTRADNVFGLEAMLAKASMTATERRDPDSTYNLFEPDQLGAKYHGVDWLEYVKSLGFDGPRAINIAQPDFIAAAIALLSDEPLANWHDYLLVHSLLPLLTKLGPAYEQLHFGFYGKVLRGVTEPEPRFKRIIQAAIMMLPEPAGQLFVESYFDETAKQAIYDLVGHLKLALRGRLERLDWMSDDTKTKALAKLETFLPLLGYPDTWRDYSDLRLGSIYADNFLAVSAEDWQHSVKRIGEPVDRREWLMSPVAVNAYYWPNTNGITFPAGILQPPFFDARGDFAANYGSIGAVIGHEITHGFDDEGSKFDADGNLKSWWTSADREAFDARAHVLVEQYNGYTVQDRAVNGQLTLGENIADLGGVHMAFDALKAKLAELGTSDAIDGFSPEQRFFIGYARSWRENIRPELSLIFLVSDPHSPDKFRTNGIVRNCDAFYEAFEVEPGNELYLAPDARVRIW